MAAPRKKTAASTVVTPQWNARFEIQPVKFNLHDHIDFYNRWWPKVIWIDGVWPKHNSNIIVDITGQTYTFCQVLVRSTNMDTPFPTEALYLIETPSTVTVCSNSSFWSYGKKVLAEGRKGERMWSSYLNYLMEFALVTYSREDWNRLQVEGHITIVENQNKQQ